MKNLWGLGSHSIGRICIILEHKETKGHFFNVPKILPLGRRLRRQRWTCRHALTRFCNKTMSVHSTHG
jgi:hypothetical protein